MCEKCINSNAKYHLFRQVRKLSCNLLWKTLAAPDDVKNA